MLDKIKSIMIDQMDIASDSEKFLVGSSKRTMFNGAQRYFASGLLDCQCGINVNILCFKFELKQDDNPSYNFYH